MAHEVRGDHLIQLLEGVALDDVDEPSPDGLVALLWPSLEVALAANTEEFQDALRGALSTSAARVPGLARFGRIWRRFFFGAVLDREAPRRELADGLRALLRGLAPPELVPPSSRGQLLPE